MSPGVSGLAGETQGDLVSKTRNRKLVHVVVGGDKKPFFSFTLATVLSHARQAPFSLSVFVRDSSELFCERSREIIRVEIQKDMQVETVFPLDHNGSVLSGPVESV